MPTPRITKDNLWIAVSLAVVALAIGVTPLLFSTASRELFEFPKMVWIYGLAIISGGLLIWQSWQRNNLVLPPSWLSRPIAAYLITFIISCGLSLSIYTSIMGYFSRFHGGLASLIAYLLIAWLSYTVLQLSSPRQRTIVIRSWLITWVVSATMVAIWAVLEHLGIGLSCWLLLGTIDTSCWVQDVQARVFATFGQPNWLAAYLLTSLPITIAFLTSLKSTWWRLALVGAWWLQFAALWFTFSRAGWVGLVAVVLTLIIGLSPKFWKAHWIWVTLGLVGCLIIAVSAGEMASQRTSTSLEGGDFDSSTGHMRLLVWRGSLDIIAQYPLFGSGPETFPYSFLAHRPVEMNQTTEWNFLYNKAHNEWLQTITDRGIIGLAAWLWLWLALLIWAWRNSLVKAQAEQPMQIISVALLAGLAGLLASQFFGFSVVVTGLISWLSLALLAGMSNQSPIRLAWSAKRWPRIVGLTLAILAISTASYGLVRYSWAEIVSTQAGRSSFSTNQLLGHPQRAVQLNPWEPHYAQQLALHYSQGAVGSQDPDRSLLAHQALTWAIKAESLNPHNLIIKKQLGWTYANLSQISPDTYGPAEIQLWQRAVELAPTDADAWRSLVEVYAKYGQTEQAAMAKQHALNLKPDLFQVD